MKSGDRIVYCERKVGVFYGLVRHTCRWTGRQMALVHFVDAARGSRVQLRHLKPFPQEVNPYYPPDNEETNAELY